MVDKIWISVQPQLTMWEQSWVPRQTIWDGRNSRPWADERRLAADLRFKQNYIKCIRRL